jgi:hypothetical protein
MYIWREIVLLKDGTVDRIKEVQGWNSANVDKDFLRMQSQNTKSKLLRRLDVFRDNYSYVQTVRTSRESRYISRVDFSRQELIVLNVHHQKGDPVHLSDAMFDTWKQAFNNNPGEKQLLRIIYRPVQNIETRDALKPYRSPTAQPYQTMNSFQPGDAVFQMVLQKPLGRAANRMVADYGQQLAPGSKQIARMDIVWGTLDSTIYSITCHLN